MKNNTSLIFNIVLAVAVLGLYILHFSSANGNTETSKKKTPKKVVKTTEGEKAAPLNIAYVNIDTLNKNYEFAKQSRKDMETKERILQSEIDNRVRNWQNEVVTYQKGVSSMTIQQAKAKEQELQQKQMQIEQYRQTVASDFIKQEQKINEKLIDNVSAYLKQYSEENGYDYILTYSKLGGGILFGDESRDITIEVLEGLNEEYKKEGKSEDETSEKEEKKEKTKMEKK